jgi:DNA-binding LacI/PurR family transcriptional regulator/ABC-type glycerol-3-phosphate transport system substrate-binding protein
MATINDVAKQAGVSRGTVSNIINGKPGVSRDKVDRVYAAIEALQYVPDATARILKTNKTKRVAVVLPNILDAYFAYIFTGIERVLSEAGYTASLYMSCDIEPKENNILEQVKQHKMDGVILATCQPGASEQFRQLRDKGMKLVFVEREPLEQDFSFLGFDVGASLKSILEDRIAKGYKEIGLFAGPDSYSCEAQCIETWRTTLSEHRIPLDQHFLAITNFNKESAFQAAMRLFQSANLPEIIIATSKQILEGLLKALEYTVFPRALEPEMICLGESSWSDHSYPDIVRVDRQAIRLGEMAAEQLIEEIENPVFSESKRILLKNDEVVPPRPQMKSYTASRGTCLKVAMLKGEALEATSQLAGDFLYKAGIDLEIDGFDYAGLWDAIHDESSRNKYDVFEVDIPWLEEFSRSGFLEPLDDQIRSLLVSSGHFIPGILDVWSKVDETYWSFPYKFGTQILFYRKDLFEDSTIKRRFHDLYKAELRPPCSWKEYNTIAHFFTRSFTPESPVAWGTTLGGSVFSGAICEFLPRKWAYEDLQEAVGQLYPQDEHATLLALKNYVESFNYAPPGSENNWWNEQVAQFASGETAMMVMFIAHATKLTDRRFSRVIGKIGYSFVPGNTPVLGGWSLAINRKSDKKSEAVDFLCWLTQRDIAIPHTILGGASPSVDLYKNSELVEIYPWLPKALETFPISRRRSSFTVKDGSVISEHILEKVLGEAVHGCVSKMISPEDALSRLEREMAALRDAQER